MKLGMVTYNMGKYPKEPTCRMKPLHVLFCFLLVSVLAGCDKHGQSIPQDRFQIEVDNVVEDNQLFVIRLNLRFAGVKRVYVSQGNNGEMSLTTLEKPGKEPCACELIILADLIDQSGIQSVRWLCRLEDGTSTAGGPSLFPVKDQEKIRDVAQVTITSGQYPLERDIELGTFQKEPLRLRVSSNIK